MLALRLGGFLMGRSALVYGVELYGGLVVFAGYILVRMHDLGTGLMEIICQLAQSQIDELLPFLLT